MTAEIKCLPCPFCGSAKVTLENTHTAAYWIECQCGAEMHGAACVGKSQAAHRKAQRNAIAAWNNRTETALISYARSAWNLLRSQDPTLSLAQRVRNAEECLSIAFPHIRGNVTLSDELGEIAERLHG